MRLRQLRKELGYSQQKMAEFLCITQQAYANYESGKREPSINTLRSLADIFSVTIDYLLDEPSDNSSKALPDQAVGSYNWFYQGLIEHGLIEPGVDLTDSDIDFILSSVSHITQQLQEYKKSQNKEN